MTAKCIARSLTDEQRRLSQVPKMFHPVYQISVGREYLVLGVSFMVNSASFGSTSLFEVCDDAGRCISMPTALFEIVDPRPSSFWVGKLVGLDFLLWPQEFYRKFFHDDLSEGDPETVKVFKELFARMKSESEMRLV